MYIESVNLPEFLDEAFFRKERRRMRGYFKMTYYMIMLTPVIVLIQTAISAVPFLHIIVDLFSFIRGHLLPGRTSATAGKSTAQRNIVAITKVLVRLGRETWVRLGRETPA